MNHNNCVSRLDYLARWWSCGEFFYIDNDGNIVLPTERKKCQKILALYLDNFKGTIYSFKSYQFLIPSEEKNN